MTNMKPHSRRHNFHIIINRSSFQCQYIFFNSCLPVSENTRKIAMNHTTSTKSKISCKRGPTSSTAVIHELWNLNWFAKEKRHVKLTFWDGTINLIFTQFFFQEIDEKKRSKLCAVSGRVELNLHVAAHYDVKLVSLYISDVWWKTLKASGNYLNFTFSFWTWVRGTEKFKSKTFAET